MSLRTAHGTAAACGAVVTVEVLPAEELPGPVAAAAPARSRFVGPDAVGRFGKDREAAREAGRRGGLAKANKVRLVGELGLKKIAADSAFGPYHAAASEFTTHHLGELALQAGGRVGAAPSSMVASAALQLAASRYCFDKGAESGDVALMKQGSTFADASRQNLLAAYELAVREAKARADCGAGEVRWLKPASGK